MLNKVLFSKKVFFISIFVFFITLALSYNDPLEDIFLIIAFGSLIIGLGKVNKLGSFKSIGLFFIVIILTYMMSLIYLGTKTYDMNLSNVNPSLKSEGKAILLVYQGESEQYSLSKSLNNIKLNNSFCQQIKAPFILSGIKRDYDRIGRSYYHESIESVKRKLKESLDEKDQVYIGYLKDNDYIEEVIFQIVNDGYNNIIVVPIVLTENDILSDLNRRIEKLKLFNLNIQIKYTEALWNSEDITMLYIQKIKENINSENRMDTGIILVGYCPPEHKDSQYINSVKQDLMFRKKIQSYLEKSLEIDKGKIRLGWFSDNDPSYIDEMESLLEYGVGNIICIYVKPSVTNIENKTIADSMKKRGDIPEGVHIKIKDGFLNEKAFIKELIKRIEFAKLQKWE